jgi:hypothetical protein
MTDHLEDQAMEIEALESILMDDMSLVDGAEAIPGATHAPCYQIVVSPLGDGEDEDADDESQIARLGLVFSHTPSYPDEVPLLKCRSVHGLFDAELVAVHAALTRAAETSVGCPMIYDLTQVAKEWMRDRAGVVDVVEETPEQIASRLEEEAEARLRAMRATGTPVTPETWRAWEERFEAEETLARLSKGFHARGGAGGDAAAAETPPSAAPGKMKMTGRRYFEERTAAQLDVELDGGEGDREGGGGGGGGGDDDDDFDDDDDALAAWLAARGGDGDGSENEEEEDEDEDYVPS